MVSTIRTEQQHASKLAKAKIKEGGVLIKGGVPPSQGFSRTNDGSMHDYPAQI